MKSHNKTSAILAALPGLMLLWGGCQATRPTVPKQGVVLDGRCPVVLPVNDVLSPRERLEATAWAEYAKGTSLLLDGPEAFDQAAPHLTRALSLLPDSRPIATALIGPRLAGKELEKAVADLQTVTDANPAAPIPNLLYAECLAMLHRQDEAISHLRKTIDSTQWREPQVVQTAALMMCRAQKPKQAEKFFQQAFRHRHLRDNHVLQTIAASFWLDLAEAHPKAGTDSGREATSAPKREDTAAVTPAPETIDEAPATPAPAVQPPEEGGSTTTVTAPQDSGGKTSAAPAVQPPEDSGGAPDAESESRKTAADDDAPPLDPNRPRAFRSIQEFYQAVATYDPEQCRRRARHHAGLAVALPGIPANSVWETGPDGLELLGNILLRLEAWELLDQLLEKLDGDNEYRDSTRWRLMKITLLEKRGDSEKLLHYLDSLHRQPVNLRQYREEFLLRQAIAEQYIKAESYERAVQALENVVTYYPRDFHSRLRLAQLFLYLRRANSGLAVLAPMKQLPPYGWLLSAQLWRVAGKYDQAISSLETAEKVARQLKDEDFFTASFHTTYALVCESAGKIDQAIAQSRLAHAKNPGDPSACNFLGYVLADHNRDLPEAEKLILQAVAAEPENTAYLDSLAWVYYRQRRFPEALTAIVKTVRLGGIEQDGEGVIADHAGDILAANGFLRLARHYWLLAAAANDATADKITAKLQSTPCPVRQD